MNVQKHVGQIGGFLLEARVGRGGMAEVWAVRHPETGARAALKVLDNEMSNSRELFERETMTVASLNHPGIVQLYDYGIINEEDKRPPHMDLGRMWYVMEWVAGGSLQESPPSNWSELSTVITDVLRALGNAHARGFIHRDVKPPNLLLGRDDAGASRVMLADFGVARWLRMELTMKGTETAGTPRFMSPEQFMSKTHLIGPWTDLYAFGCVIWQWVSGRQLFDDARTAVAMGFKHVNERVPPCLPIFSVPAGFDAWLARMTAKRPLQRFSHAAEALAALPETEIGPSEEYLGRRISPNVARRLAPHREYSVVGRDRERQRLRREFSRVSMRARPRITLLYGESGLGKTRLAEWLAQRTHELGHAFTLMVPYGLAAATDAVSRALAVYFRCVGRTRAEALERIAESLESAFLGIDVVADMVSAFLVDDVPHAAVREDVVHQVAVDLMRAMARDKTLVVVLDDVQDGADLSWLPSLLRADNARVHVVLTTRSSRIVEYVHAIGESALDSMNITALSETAIRELAAMSVGGFNRMADRIVELAGGSPASAIQLATEFAQSEDDDATTHGFDLSHDEDFWRARLFSAFEDDPKQTADRQVAFEIAATLGREVRTREWTAALNVAGILPPTDVLETLVVRRIARWTEEGWRFEDERHREFLIDAARSQHRRREHHVDCARALVELGPDDHTLLFRASDHLLAADRVDDALEELLKAARMALDREHFGYVERYAADLNTYIETLPIDGTDPRVGWCTYLRLAAGRNRRPLEETVELARDLIDVSRRNGWYEIMAYSSWVMMSGLNGLGSGNEAAMVGTAGVRVFERLGMSRQAARLRGSLAYVMFYVDGEFEAGIRLAEKSMREAKALDDLETVARNHDRLGYAHLKRYEYVRAREHYEDGRNIAQRLGMRELVGHIVDGLGTIARDTGQLDEALRFLDEARAAFASVGSQAEWMSRYKTATVHALQGDWMRALSEFKLCRAMFLDFGTWNYCVQAMAGIAASNAEISSPDLVASVEELVSTFLQGPVADPDIDWLVGRLSDRVGPRERALLAPIMAYQEEHLETRM